MKKADAKFDAPLRHRMHEMDQQDDPTPIVCLIQLKTPLAGSQLRQLEDAGLRLVNVMNDIAVAEGSAAALRRAARYDFVLWLELSRTQSPSNAGRD